MGANDHSACRSEKLATAERMEMWEGLKMGIWLLIFRPFIKKMETLSATLSATKSKNRWAAFGSFLDHTADR